MRKKLLSLISIVLIMFIFGCSYEHDRKVVDNSSTYDINLTKGSNILVFSEIVNILESPDDYLGKKIVVKGYFDYYKDVTTNKEYYSVFVTDEAGCCRAGFEFVPEGEAVYPDDFAPIGDEITIGGTFDTYEEGDYVFAVLKDATIYKSDFVVD